MHGEAARNMKGLARGAWQPPSRYEKAAVSASFGNDNHKPQPQLILTAYPAALEKIYKDDEK
jgi:hypothetical protein